MCLTCLVLSVYAYVYMCLHFKLGNFFFVDQVPTSDNVACCFWMEKKIRREQSTNVLIAWQTDLNDRRWNKWMIVAKIDVDFTNNLIYQYYCEERHKKPQTQCWCDVMWSYQNLIYYFIFPNLLLIDLFSNRNWASNLDWAGNLQQNKKSMYIDRGIVRVFPFPLLTLKSASDNNKQQPQQQQQRSE